MVLGLRLALGEVDTISFLVRDNGIAWVQVSGEGDTLK
jgi:hypothetical protein